MFSELTISLRSQSEVSSRPWTTHGLLLPVSAVSWVRSMDSGGYMWLCPNCMRMERGITCTWGLRGSSGLEWCVACGIKR